MALEQKLNLKLSQRLVMTPSLQQAIKLLQLSRLELSETLSQEILENPVLDVDGPGDEFGQIEQGSKEGEAAEAPSPFEANSPQKSESQSDVEGPESYNEIDVEAFFADYLADSRPEGPSMARRDTDPSLTLENSLSDSPGLYDHLEWQLHLVDCPDEIVSICEFILGNLDEDGFLRAADDEIMRATDATEAELQTALGIVRAFDPTGVGTRSLRECMLVQVDHLIDHLDPNGANGDREVLTRAKFVLENLWDDLLHQRWKIIAEALECDISEIRGVLDIVQRLETKPGRRFQQARNAFIEPDVTLKKVNGDYMIILNDDGMPRLRINPGYSRMLEGSGLDPKVNSYLKDKMRSALWLIKSIDQRQRTIYKVAESIVNFQKDFLDHGIEHLRPLVLRQVADDIGMHESTISRVVSNKYMDTPRGLFPMKFFFHSGVDSARGGSVSSLVVKERIRKMIGEEDEAKPLSDSKIMKNLQKEGIRLARRTVAKYREELGIPSSDKRKNSLGSFL